MKRRRSGDPIEVVGPLHFDEATERPQFPFAFKKGFETKTLWYDLLPTADADSIRDFRTRQLQEPVSLAPALPDFWAYRNKVARHNADVPGGPTTPEEIILLVKHSVLRQETSIERIRREVEAMENLDRVPSAQRERIPEHVRLFVWQRDEGRCVSCGSRERLEFDHIIPAAEGGSSTERNVQLLCEACNRRKGRRV